MTDQPKRDRLLPVYEKYHIYRTDGRDATGEKHDGCAYFVLDLTHDPHAIPALEAYLVSCRQDFPFLSARLETAVHQMRAGKPPWRKLSTRKKCVESMKGMMTDEDFGEQP